MVQPDEYVTLVLNRAAEPIPPVDHEPDWSDAPRDVKVFAHAPSWVFPDDHRNGRHLVAPDDELLSRLGTLFKWSYGRLSRRLAVNANDDPRRAAAHSLARWSRGVASGGGRYPVAIYALIGSHAAVPPGVYFYSPDQHALQQLALGNVANISSSDGVPDSLVLVLSVKFWQNSFKYANFSYQAVTMDIGTLLETWTELSSECGLNIEADLWPDEASISEMLGLDPYSDGIFAIVRVQLASAASPRMSSTVGRAHGAVVTRTEDERSKSVQVFDMIRDLQERALSDQLSDAPDVGGSRVLYRSTDGDIALPGVLTRPMPEPSDVLRERVSSFGRFDSREISASQLHEVLQAATNAGVALQGNARLNMTTKILKFCVLVNAIDDLAPGIYEYNPISMRLSPIRLGAVRTFIERNYFLTNYRPADAAAVIVPIGRPYAMVAAAGAMGIRLLNAQVGAAAQSIYFSCAQLHLGCGAALGFDNEHYKDELRLQNDEVPLLTIMIGHNSPNVANYRFDVM